MQATGTEYWRQAWIERERLRRAQEAQPTQGNDVWQDSAYWDSRAANYAAHAGSSSYCQAFIDLLGQPKKKLILDFGAGAGTLAIPLAKAENRVLACDFSAKMLEGLAHRAEAEKLTLVADINAIEATAKQRFASLGSSLTGGQIAPKLLSWADNWADAGIGEKSVDIAIASRSTMVADLGEAFDRLERTARERVAVTMATEFRPRSFKMLGSDADGASAMGGYVPDHILAMNILFFKGAYPELHYIDSYKDVEKTEPAQLAATDADAQGNIAAAPPGATAAATATATATAATTAATAAPPAAAATATATATAAATTAAADTASEPEQRLVRWAFITWEPVH
jgi:SAM-dependent methyltransferase